MITTRITVRGISPSRNFVNEDKIIKATTGSTVKEEGSYTLVVTDEAGNKTEYLGYN